MSDQASSGQYAVIRADILQLGVEIKSLQSSVGQILSYLHAQSHPPLVVPGRAYPAQYVSAETYNPESRSGLPGYNLSGEDSRSRQSYNPVNDDNDLLRSYNQFCDGSRSLKPYNPSVASEPSIETASMNTSVDDVTGLVKGTKQQDMTASGDNHEEEEISFIVLETSSSTKTRELEDSDITCVSYVTGEMTRTQSVTSLCMEDQIQQLNQKVEQLENRFSDQINIPMSKFQTEMREILSPARSSQAELHTAVKQQRASLDDIHDMTGRLSNQLNTVIEQTHDVTPHVDAAVRNVLKSLQNTQASLEKLTSLNTGNVEEIKAQLKEMVQAAETSIQARTMSDLAWLKEEVDDIFAQMLLKVTSKVQEISMNTDTFASKTEVATDLLSKQIMDLAAVLDEKILDVLNEVRTVNQQSTETITEKVKEYSKKAFEQLQTSAMSAYETGAQSITDDMDKRSDPVNISSQQMIDEIQKIVKTHNEGLQERMQTFFNVQGDNTRIHINRKLTENKALLDDAIYKLKREIFAFTEKECQLVRDRIEGPLPSHKTYTLDFYVENFKSLINSSTERHSPPWHINQFKSSLQGNVTFVTKGKLNVWIIYSRNPREVGLQPRPCGKLKVKVTIIDTTGKLPDLQVGNVMWNVTEDGIKNNDDRGIRLGELDCQDIVNKGYADVAGHKTNSVLVRYILEVL